MTPVKENSLSFFNMSSKSFMTLTFIMRTRSHREYTCSKFMEWFKVFKVKHFNIP